MFDSIMVVIAVTRGRPAFLLVYDLK